MGRVTAGNNIGSGIATPVVASLITLVGWRWTFGVLGIALFGLAILIVLVVSDNPDDVENERGKKMVTTRADRSFKTKSTRRTIS